MLRSAARQAPKKVFKKASTMAAAVPGGRVTAAVAAANAGAAPPKVTLATKKAMAGKLRFDSSKAGLQSVDKAHVEKVIQEASKNSQFALKEQQREEARQKRAQEMLRKAEKYEQLSDDAKDDIRAEVDALEEMLEQERDMGRKFIHVDMDMFFAAVAEKKNPRLHDVPFGVGSRTMLSTTNYLARQYGVRSGMPGFIGQKLCPELVIVPVDFPAYQREAAAIQNIAKRYDPNFVSLGLDEMTMDVTEYLRANPGLTAQDVCSAYRLEVFAATQLTCSGGIAPTGALAKIACNVNKPNGQHELKLTTREDVLEYMQTVPLRMVPGIGYAQELVLNALGIKTCGDLLANKYLLAYCFKRKTFQHYLACGLGLMPAHGHNQHDGPQSIGKEMSFNELNSAEAFWQLLRTLLVPCHAQIVRQRLLAGRLCLVLKTRSFDATLHSISLDEPSSDLKVLLEAGRKLLAPHLANFKDFRLLGVRLQKLSPDPRHLVTSSGRPSPAAVGAAATAAAASSGASAGAFSSYQRITRPAPDADAEEDEEEVDDEEPITQPAAKPAPIAVSSTRKPSYRPYGDNYETLSRRSAAAEAAALDDDAYAAYDDIDLDEEEEDGAPPSPAASTHKGGAARHPTPNSRKAADREEAEDDEDDDLLDDDDLDDVDDAPAATAPTRQHTPAPASHTRKPVFKKPSASTSASSKSKNTSTKSGSTKKKVFRRK